MDEDYSTKTKTIGDILKERMLQAREANLPEDEYEHYVYLTAKMLYGTKIGKSGKEVCKKRTGYFTLHTIFDREQWPTEKIKHRYHHCEKHHGRMPVAVFWWWLRKQDNAK
jgi:hypothetical protein